MIIQLQTLHEKTRFSSFRGYLLFPLFLFFFSLFFFFCLGFVSDIGERYLMVKTDRFDFDFLSFFLFFLFLFFSHF